MAASKKSFRVWLLRGLAAFAVIAAAWWFLQEEDSLKVPLGVEQAAIVTYGGPPLMVKPFKWGVGVNLRIAQVSERDGLRVYDIRYLANRAGTFDLRDYLASEDGRPLDGLPSFRFTGDPKLSKDLESRIRETEPAAVEIGGYYTATMAALGVAWLGWLLLLIFYGRPKPAVVAPPSPPPTLAEQFQALLRQVEAGTLDAAGAARLEMLLLRAWREGLVTADAPMAQVLAAVAAGERTRDGLRTLQHWLHRREATVTREEIAALIRPLAQPAAAAAEAEAAAAAEAEAAAAAPRSRAGPSRARTDLDFRPLGLAWRPAHLEGRAL